MQRVKDYEVRVGGLHRKVFKVLKSNLLETSVGTMLETNFLSDTKSNMI